MQSKAISILSKIGRAIRAWVRARIEARRVDRNVIRARVIEAVDGDTIRVNAGLGNMTIRIAGIDAPESRPLEGAEWLAPDGQPFGRDARQALAQLIHGQSVVLRFTGRRSYGRPIAHVYLGDMDVGLEMVRQGYACHYERFAAMYQDVETFNAYRLAELAAKTAGKGQWRQAGIIEPWRWRQQLRRAADL